MSEHDSDGDTGRKGFVRDVMRRISPSGGRVGDEPDPAGRGDRVHQSDVEHLQDAIRFFGSDSSEFRHRLDRVLADDWPKGRCPARWDGDTAARAVESLRQRSGVDAA